MVLYTWNLVINPRFCCSKFNIWDSNWIHNVVLERNTVTDIHEASPLMAERVFARTLNTEGPLLLQSSSHDLCVCVCVCVCAQVWLKAACVHVHKTTFILNYPNLPHNIGAVNHLCSNEAYKPSSGEKHCIGSTVSLSDRFNATVWHSPVAYSKKSK